MFGYVMTYVGGIATGITLIWMNRKSVEDAVSECKKNFDRERQKLLDDNKRTNEMLFRRCTDEAFRQGFEKGRIGLHDAAEASGRSLESGMLPLSSETNINAKARRRQPERPMMNK